MFTVYPSFAKIEKKIIKMSGEGRGSLFINYFMYKKVSEEGVEYH